MAPNPPALVTPRGTRGAPRFCVPCGPLLNRPGRGRNARSFPCMPPSRSFNQPVLTPLGGGSMLPNTRDPMGAKVARIDATLGAVVTELELARMDERTWKTVEQAFHEHGVLV